MLKFLYKPLLVILITVIFFLSYNKFLLDRSLEDLKFSLDVISKAESTEEAEDVKIVLELLLLDKVASKEFDTAELAALEYAHGVMVKGADDNTRELKDAVVSVKEIVEKKVKEREIRRGKIVASLDTVSRTVTRNVDRLQSLPAALTSREDEGKEIDEGLLTQANLYDKEWKLAKAKEAYEELISKYPDYKEVKSIKLQLAYVYQKIGLYDKAEKLYKDIAGDYHGTIEARAAEKLLRTLGTLKKLADGREKLLKEIPSIVSKEKLQDAYYKLGIISMQLLDFVVARNAFEKVREINPASELAMKAKFNIGWSYKFQAQLNEGVSTFEEFIQEYPEAGLAVDAKYQLANIYHRQEKYEEAAMKYKEIADEYKDNSIAPMALLQSSMTYLYDLNDPERAREKFEEFREKYTDTEAAGLKSEYAKEVIPEEAVPEGQLDAILLRGATGFANTVLGMSRDKSLGQKTPYEKIYTEADINSVVSNMLADTGLKDTVTDTYINFTENGIEGTGFINLGKLSIKASGLIKAEAVRGGFRFTVEEYKFTFGNSKVPLPLPRFLLDRMTQKINGILTKKNLLISVEEIVLTEHNAAIKGYRY